MRLTVLLVAACLALARAAAEHFRQVIGQVAGLAPARQRGQGPEGGLRGLRPRRTLAVGRRPARRRAGPAGGSGVADVVGRRARPRSLGRAQAAGGS